MKKQPFTCPVEATLALIGGKYKPLLLWHLKDGPRRYMALQRLLPGATPKMLTQQLRALTDCGMVRREVIPARPPQDGVLPHPLRGERGTRAGRHVPVGP